MTSNGTGARANIRAGRQAVYTKDGVVSSQSPMASSTGIRVLAEGGNAFDAATAMAAVEAVTCPMWCGIGGEPFIIMYEAKTGKVYGLNGSGKAPMAADRDYYVSRGYSTMPRTGPHSAAIPGEIDSYYVIQEKFGTRSVASLLQYAIDYAENGFVLSDKLGSIFTNSLSALREFSDTAAIFTRYGTALGAGDILVNKDLAKTLRTVAEQGPDVFYRGAIAKEMVRALQAAGSLYTEEEFAQYKTNLYETPISTTYRGHTVYETNPPSQGLIVLEMLNIIEGFDLASMGFYSADAVHVMVEAKKLAYADRNAYMGDPDFVESPTSELISKDFAEMRRREINMDKSVGNVEAGPLGVIMAGGNDTTYFCVVDGEGNAVSMIHSLSDGFGSRFVAGNTGVLLNNRIGRGFSLEEGHPNVIEPGKKTMHTLNAFMVMNEDRPYIVAGTPGGDRQVSWNVQMISNVIDYGMGAQEALEAPCWNSWPGTDPANIDDPVVVELEPGMTGVELAKLEAKGHAIKHIEVRPGSTKLILIDPDTGVRMGASDPRTDGHAAAL